MVTFRVEWWARTAENPRKREVFNVNTGESLRGPDGKPRTFKRFADAHAEANRLNAGVGRDRMIGGMLGAGERR